MSQDERDRLRRETEQRYRSLFEHHPDAIFSWDTAGIYVTANPACEAVCGYRPEELVGLSLSAHVLPEYLSLAQAKFQSTLAGIPQSFECGILVKDGARILLGVTMIPIVIDSRVAGVFGIARDLTEQHSLEARLRQAQKMEAVGRLAGGIAHDFNNLLSAIQSHCELVLSEFPETSVRQDIEVVHQLSQRAADLIRQLLAFSRHQVIPPQFVDVNLVVKDTKRMLRRMMGNTITLVTDLVPTGAVLADPGQLTQVLLNLALNARDAMPDGGTLTIRTGEVMIREEGTRLPELPPGTYVTLSVEDTGRGIPREVHSKIFEPFFTTKGIGQGSGLGLAVVYGIVRQWAGEIEFESTPGSGSRFTLLLLRRDAPILPETPESDWPVRGTGQTVLVVEDEALVRSSIRRILTRHGYVVLEASHGADALRQYHQLAGGIDLIVTDLVMPEMDGRALITALKSVVPAPRVLMMSGYDEQISRGESLPPGVRFVAKPFTMTELLCSIGEALAAPPIRP